MDDSYPRAPGTANVIVRGRPAWIAAIIAGIILAIVGGAAFRPPSVPIIIGGCAFTAVGIVFLILSFVTHGATD